MLQEQELSKSQLCKGDKERREEEEGKEEEELRTLITFSLL